MAKNSAAGLLTSVDSMFTTQEERDNAQRSYLIDIPTSEISDFPNHPFHVRIDEEMERLVESVKERGVLSAVLVRPMPDGGYQMVSGHRRKRAAELAELPTLSCVVRELTDDEATIIMVDSNLQREKVLPSEKAFAYKMKLDAMRRQAGRPSKNNSVPVGQNFGQTSREVLAANSPDSNTQIQRYIRLTNLIPELLNMVDENKIALRPAVELSYLSETEQNALKDAMESEDCTPSHAQAIKLRKFAEDAGQDTAIVNIKANDGAAIDNRLIYGEIHGLKKDDDGNALGGAVMGLFRADETEFTADNALVTATSAEDGSFAFDKVPYGNWLVREIESPKGFLLSDVSYPVEVAEDGAVIEVEIENTRIRGTVQLTKVDENYPDNKLTGAAFDVYRDSNGNKDFVRE